MSSTNEANEFRRKRSAGNLMSSNESDFEEKAGIFAQTEHDGNSSHESVEPAPKKIKTEWSKSYSVKSINMMKKFGYVENQGLGKQGQGRIEPVEASQQIGRHGFGLKLQSLDESIDLWGNQTEQIEIPESIDWLRNDSTDLENLTMEDLVNSKITGPLKLSIEDECRFCEEEILENVLKSKSVFDNLNGTEMRRARTRSNPFETIRGCIFLNRAAVKMANIDSLCDFMFTNPVDENGASLVRDGELLYFADICAGPGGFSEYMLYRRGWQAKGFGFTLKNENDFKLSEFHAASPETFDPYYGVHDNGDIYDPENQESFAKYVLQHVDSGVHIVMADGGFSVEGNENIQEILSKQLYLCQCLTALSILRDKGHFVCKLFDLFTPFSVSLIYLMYKCFESISICKPNTSRPANSERYLICKWKKSHTDTIHRYLSEVNREIIAKENCCELFKCDEIEQEFLNYIIKSNNRIGQNQIIGLIKIAAFTKNQNLKELRQDECKEKCLKLWKLPNGVRKAPEIPTNDALLSELLAEWRGEKNFMSCPSYNLKSPSDLKKTIVFSLCNWYFVPFNRATSSSNNKRTFFLCKAKNNVQYVSENKWESLTDCYLELPPKTLIYGEIVTEYIGQDKSQSKVTAFHIIDGIVLGGIDIRHLPLPERLKWCDKFAKALNKPYKIYKADDRQSVSPIRCKKLYEIEKLHEFFEQMNMYRLKENNLLRLGFRIRSNEKERFFVPGGLIFLNETKDPYVRAMSKSYNTHYYYNTKNNTSFYVHKLQDSMKPEVISSFRSSFQRRLEWKWEDPNQLQLNVNEDRRHPDILYRDDFESYIASMLR